MKTLYEILTTESDYINLEKEEASAIRKALLPHVQKTIDRLHRCEKFSGIGPIYTPATIIVNDDNHDVMLYGYHVFIPMNEHMVSSIYLVDITAIKDVTFKNPNVYMTPCRHGNYIYSIDSSCIVLFKGEYGSEKIEDLQIAPIEYGDGNVYGICSGISLIQPVFGNN